MKDVYLFVIHYINLWNTNLIVAMAIGLYHLDFKEPIRNKIIKDIVYNLFNGYFGQETL